MSFRTYLPADRKNSSPNLPIPGREAEMVKNSAGGYVFSVDCWKQLLRFLVLGTEGGTYYASQEKLTTTNTKNVDLCISTDGLRTVKTVVEVSQSGRAPKNDPALFVLARCAASPNSETRKAALEALPQVARIGTHLFHFAAYVDNMRGWGRGLRQGIGNWYQEKSDLALVNQITKYQQRDGWSHRDLLRLGHPKTTDPVRNAIYKYIVKGELPGNLNSKAIDYLSAVETLKKDISGSEVLRLMSIYNLPMEVIPTDKRNREVYEMLLETGGLTWLLRNLGNLSKQGILVDQNFSQVNKVCSRLTNPEDIKRARIHPIAILSALLTYSSGSGFRSSSSWSVSQKVVNALNDAFHIAFGNVEPTGKRILIGLDVSGSMTIGDIAGVPGLTPRQASAAMCMIQLAVEQNCIVKGFSHQLIDLSINPRATLNTVVAYLNTIPFGATDCSLPMRWAQQARADFDAFIIYTDNETGSAYGRNQWSPARSHPAQELTKYRSNFVRDAKLITVGMTATNCSIADPSDAGMLDVVGFDQATPQIIRDFIVGDI